MIEVFGLKKRYGQVEAVRGVSFHVGEGEVVGLLGPNGAGKTTIMRMLTTFLPPTGGTGRVAGFDILRESEKVRQNIGYLPETPPLYPELRISEYLTFVAKIKGIPRRRVRRAVDQVIERCSLGDVRERICGQLSKGYRQRVGLAQALIHQPKVIILDEPTIGLDPAQILDIRRLIKELEGYHTVVLCSHILSEVTQTCSRAIIVSRGSVVVQGSLEALTAEKSLEARFLEAVAEDGQPLHMLGQKCPDVSESKKEVNV